MSYTPGPLKRYRIAQAAAKKIKRAWRTRKASPKKKTVANKIKNWERKSTMKFTKQEIY